jgi:hypothetical protein
LTRGSPTGLIHIEYGFAAGGTLDYLQVWSSLTRGHWLLACQYWMSANTFHSAGVGFENGYKSEGPAHILEIAMHHQNSFVLAPNLGRQGLLQISTPTAEEIAAAAALVKIAFDRLAFISGGCLMVRTIYFPKLLSGGRDAGLFVAGQC